MERPQHSRRPAADEPPLSPSALNQFLGCEHRTYLDMLDRRGELDAVRRPPELSLMLERGDRFETEVVDRMRAEGLTVVSLDGTSGTKTARAARTLEAMREGPDVVYQGCFFNGSWVGYPDFLIRMATPSDLGPWSYEVHDAKLGTEPKVAHIFQLLFYTEELQRLQGLRPARMHLILGDHETAHFDPRDYEAYAARVRATFAARRDELEAGKPPAYPYPVGACDYCPWWHVCRDRRRKDDHISLVANLHRRQGLLIEDVEIHDIPALAHAEDTVTVPKLATGTLSNLRAQADLQLRSRGLQVPLHELLEPEWGRGLARLPARSPGDLFFDFEGDPNWGEEGLEYLFGTVHDEDGVPQYMELWTTDRAEEKVALVRWIDSVVERRATYPDLHIYHYNAYEPSALKRLVARHATREEELDDLLRGKVFVDLYGIVRQAVRAGVESYGLKGIEALYRFERTPELQGAVGSLRRWQAFLDTGNRTALEPIALYNRDDCLSTRALLGWLHDRRVEAEETFEVTIDELAPEPVAEASEKRQAREARMDALGEGLLAGLPDDESKDTEDERARRLLFTLAGYHVRDAKPAWWAYFERQAKTPDQLVDGDAEAIGGLTVLSREEVKQSWLWTLAFPPQEHKIGPGRCDDAETGKGIEVLALDDAKGKVVVKRGKGQGETPPRAIVPGSPYGADSQIDAVCGLAEDVATHGLNRPGIGRDLLLRRAPRFKAGTPSLTDGRVDIPRLATQVRGLDRSVLVIQGPPGTGKTYTGARVAVALIKAGVRVGVTATAHKAINNLLAEIDRAADEAELTFRGWKRASSPEHDYESARIACSKLPEGDTGPVLLHAGTPWWWARPDAAGSVDVLLVDEAGQVSLADALAVARGADSMVLFGDPQQLAHVSQGTHPIGAGASVLEHLIAGHDTVPAGRGVLLDMSWRMHPDVCDFVSRTMYDGRLHPEPACERQRVASPGLSGTGLRMRPVAHVGNRGRSPEEAKVVAQDVRALLDGGMFTDREGTTRPLGLKDILVVAPYNAQVRCLAEALPPGARVGTVDKFQGQQAPVVFFSMATSTEEDVTRGMSFLFSRNRLNVAISRAQVLAVVVCSPRLLHARCSSVDDMRRVNMLCLAADAADSAASGARLVSAY